MLGVYLLGSKEPEESSSIQDVPMATASGEFRAGGVVIQRMLVRTALTWYAMIQPKRPWGRLLLARPHQAALQR
jgi:hypothetical protein